MGSSSSPFLSSALASGRVVVSLLEFPILFPLKVNLILVFLRVVVSNGIETLVFESKVLEFLSFSFSVVDEIGVGVVLIVVLLVVVGMVLVGVVRLLVVLGGGLTVVVGEGLLKMVKGVTFGLCVVIACLVNVGFGALGLVLSKLFGRIFVLVKLTKFTSLLVGLVLLTSCTNKLVVPLFCELNVPILVWGFPNWASKFLRSFSNWSNDWSSRRFAF